ncbi:MAG: 4-(cytidine 5'-diphospho)-2-C-methyl-D-erythritol kinase, partial [Alphaproteobacteria bacterium]
MKCPAKINIFLNIVGKKPDGYHQLESIFLPIELSDYLEIKPSSVFKLTVTGRYANKIENDENILIKILEYFKKNFQISDNFSINLQKNIPIGAG